MSRKSLRPIALTLSLLLLAAGPAQAGPVMFSDVVTEAIATDASGQQDFDLRLRLAPQGGQTTSTSNAQSQNPSSGNTGNTSTTNTQVQTAQGQTVGSVEVVQLGDVTGTVCDCGEIIAPGVGGHFPKLPFLALAAIPLLLIPRGGNEAPSATPTPLASPTPPTSPTPTPPGTPTPTPTPQPVPEPTTLLLLGTGLAALGARARRRAARAQHDADQTSAGGS